MKEIMVLTEHRKGDWRDITFELLSAARQLASTSGAKITALLMAEKAAPLLSDIQTCADTVLTVQDSRLAVFNVVAAQAIMAGLIRERKPDVVLLPHSAFGMDLAPSLAAELGMPLVTDCIKLTLEDSGLIFARQFYGGKINALMECTSQTNGPVMATVRATAYAAEKGDLSAEVIDLPSPLKEDIDTHIFLEYLEAAAGDVDITQADIVVGIGRGIKEKENLALVENLAAALGGVLACSRPIVDAGWLPKDRQVGSSGKSIKPRLYLALGISGAFQHTTGMKGAETVVAVNKDCNAPIFGVADYGIVGDLTQVVPLLTEKINEMKAG